MIILSLAAVLATGCITPRRINYLQDMTEGSQIELENRFEAVIAPYDELTINVSSAQTELAAPFNLFNMRNNIDYVDRGYLVDVNGNIEFPELGRLRVAGLTRLQLQDTLRHMLTQRGFLSDAFVNVRFKSFKIFFLGAEGGKVLNVPNERCTFLEALAMSGDFNNYTRRDHIAVMREINGKMVMHFLDPRSSDIFNDPFFMLQQNDFIITEKWNSGLVRSEATYWLGWVSTVLSAASLITSLLLYRSMSN